MTRFRRTAKPEELPMETQVTETADITTDNMVPETQVTETTVPDIQRTASFPTYAGLSSKTALRKRKKFWTAFRIITETRNGISSKEAYITAGAGLGKHRDASREHTRWNREIRNMPRHISAWHTSSDTVLPREEPPRPSSTAVPVIAVIAAQRLCVWTASATVFAATAAVKN